MLGIVFNDARSRYQRANVQAAPVQQNNTQYVSPTFEPTRTPIPSATIGYESTLAIAQSTADEARRINAQVTSEHEQRILEQLQMTAAYEQRVQEIYSWTATAALTSIPLTSTQQAVINTQVLDEQRIIAAQMTATQQAPTQYAAMVRAENTVKFAKMDSFVRVVGILSLSVFMLGLTYFILSQPVRPIQIKEDKTETVIKMRRETGQGTFTQQRLVVPCSPEQLTELAELAANGEKKFGINRLESNSRTFKSQREILIAVRQFLIDNSFVITDGNGTITLNDEGEAFLLGWFESHELPDKYDFLPEEIQQEPN